MPRTLHSYFAGIGGFDLAFERAGFQTTMLVEIDAPCRKVLKARFPSAAQWDDVCTFDPSKHACPTAITFGSPCQDLSVAGARAGMVEGGTRSGLFYEAIRIIRFYAQRGLEFAVWENVPGAFSSDAGRDFACVLRAMAECGAVDVAWRVLDAQYAGLAQRRERVFLVADFRGERAAEILSFEQGLRGDPAPRRETRERVAGSLSARTEGGGGLGTDFELGGGCSKSLKASDGGIDREDGHTLIPDVVGALSDGAHHGGGLTAKTPTPDASSLPPVSRCLNAGGMGRQDYETETLLPMRRGGSFDEAIPILEAGARTGKSTDDPRAGIGIGAPGDPMFTLQSGKQHAVAFHENQRGEVTVNDTAGALKVGGGKPGQGYPAIAFTLKESGGDAQTELSPTLRAGGHTESHANGGVMPAIAIRTAQTSANGHGVSEEVAHTLDETQGQPVAFDARQSDVIQYGDKTDPLDTDGHTIGLCVQGGSQQDQFVKPGGVSPTLAHSSCAHQGHHQPKLWHEYGVRRLTPLECLRLMGFPDDWLDGLELSDSSKYRMCGNSVAVPCVEFIAQAIAKHLKCD